MPQSARILTTACPKPAVPLEDCHREYGKATRSASPRSSRYTGPSSFPPSCTVQRLTNAACAPQMAKPRVERRSPQESQPAQHRVHLASGAAALGWPRHKDGRCTHSQSSLLQRTPRRKTRSWCSKKKLYKDQLKRQLAQAGISRQLC